MDFTWHRDSDLTLENAQIIQSILWISADRSCLSQKFWLQLNLGFKQQNTTQRWCTLGLIVVSYNLQL